MTEQFDLSNRLQNEINYFMEIKHTEISSWAKKIIEERLLKIKKGILEFEKAGKELIEDTQLNQTGGNTNGKD
jgi:hypothetical protein